MDPPNKEPEEVDEQREDRDVLVLSFSFFLFSFLLFFLLLLKDVLLVRLLLVLFSCCLLFVFVFIFSSSSSPVLSPYPLLFLHSASCSPLPSCFRRRSSKNTVYIYIMYIQHPTDRKQCVFLRET